MTRDRARKKAIRSRMAGTGEPYSLAARRLGGSQPADDEAALRAVIACARNTLAAPSARIEIRSDWEITRHQGEPRLNVIGKLARFAVRSALKRVEPEMSMAELREAFMHTTGDGFVEPAAGRYLIDLGGHALMASDGKHFSGPSGRPLGAGYQDSAHTVDPLEVLCQLRDATGARYAGGETVRGTQCRVATVSSDTAEFTVWMSDEHFRRIQFEERPSRRNPRVTAARRRTIELWDFGVPVDSLDWSRLPSFRTPRDGAEHTP